MVYKLNMFLREWEGYDKIYNFLKTNMIYFLTIKLIICLFTFVFFFIKINIITSVLRTILYLTLFIAEYFTGCMQKDEEELSLSYASFFLMSVDLLVAILCFINIFTYV